MKVFVGNVRPVGGLVLDGLLWGMGVGFVLPAGVGTVAGVLGGSPALVGAGLVYGLVGLLVGGAVGLGVGLAAGLLVELWSALRAPTVVVTFGTLGPVLVGLVALGGGFGEDGVGGWAMVVPLLVAGPLVPDVALRARRLERDRAARARQAWAPQAYSQPYAAGPQDTLRPAPQDAPSSWRTGVTR